MPEALKTIVVNDASHERYRDLVTERLQRMRSEHHARVERWRRRRESKEKRLEASLSLLTLQYRCE